MTPICKDAVYNDKYVYNNLCDPGKILMDKMIVHFGMNVSHLAHLT